MKGLIRITQGTSLGQVVSARDLYDFLKIKEQFTDWMKRMFEYGFAEHVDWILLHENLKQKSGSSGHNKLYCYERII